MCPADEREMGQFEWMAATETVEKKTLEFLGADFADLLKAHHRNVIELTKEYSWRVASLYDKKSRDLLSCDNRHDVRLINQRLVTLGARGYLPRGYIVSSL